MPMWKMKFIHTQRCINEYKQKRFSLQRKISRLKNVCLHIVSDKLLYSKVFPGKAQDIQDYNKYISTMKRI